MRLPRSVSARLPRAWIGGVFLAIAVQAAAWHTPLFWQALYRFSTPLNDDPVRFQAVLRKARAAEGKPRIVIMGSSQARENIDARALEGLLEGAGHPASVSNLGISGGGPPLDMLMLVDEVLGLHPDLVVYMPYYGSFYQRYDFLKLPFYFDWKVVSGLRQTLGLEPLLQRRDVLTAVGISHLFPLYRFRDPLRRILHQALGYAARGEWKTEPEMFAYTESRPASFFEAVLAEDDGPVYEASPFYDMNRHMFGEYHRHLRDAGIPLMVVDGPTHPLMDTRLDPKLPRAYRDMLAREARRQGFRFVPLEALPPFPPGQFADFTHLNPTGRRGMTQALADLLLEEM